MSKHDMSARRSRREAIDAEAAQWLARRDADQGLSETERAALEAWLVADTAHEVALLRLESAWERADHLRELPPSVHQAQRGDREQSSGMSQRWWRYLRGWRGAGASLALAGVLAAGVLTLRPSPLFAPGEEHFATAVGARQELSLSDGSRVTLNTNTRARARVNPEQRTFWLDEGEAFFDIRHDPKHPFVIAAGKDRITVLGTKFSVRHEGGTTRVTVLEGRVKLDQADGSGTTATSTGTATLLARNSSAEAESGRVVVSMKSPEQTLQAMSWRDGRVDFEDATLTDIAAEFNRYNRRQLVIDPSAAQLRLSGRFDTTNLDGFLRLVHSGLGVKVDAQGDRVSLSLPG